MTLTKELRAEYEELYKNFSFDSKRMAEREYYVKRITDRRSVYEEVAAGVGAPWYLIGVIHMMECGLDFRCHLHNGDPLHQRTTHYPPGRPVYGQAPFRWEVSAQDALTLKSIQDVRNWDIATLLFTLERYNGFGYRLFHSEVKSPYLWAGTRHYTKGKYGQDGKFDPNLTSKQLGAVPVLARLIEIERSQSEQTGVT